MYEFNRQNSEFEWAKKLGDFEFGPKQYKKFNWIGCGWRHSRTTLDIIQCSREAKGYPSRQKTQKSTNNQ